MWLVSSNRQLEQWVRVGFLRLPGQGAEPGGHLQPAEPLEVLLPVLVSSFHQSESSGVPNGKEGWLQHLPLGEARCVLQPLCSLTSSVPKLPRTECWGSPRLGAVQMALCWSCLWWHRALPLPGCRTGTAATGWRHGGLRLLVAGCALELLCPSAGAPPALRAPHPSCGVTEEMAVMVLVITVMGEIGGRLIPELPNRI